MGIAIGGLALMDPNVANHSLTFTAVMAGTIIGQQAPDVDTVLKLRNNAVYIRHLGHHPFNTCVLLCY